MDGASKATLENEFGTSNDEEAIKQILEKGTLQESQVRIHLPHAPSLPPLSPSIMSSNILTYPAQAGERQGNQNYSMGSRAAH